VLQEEGFEVAQSQVEEALTQEERWGFRWTWTSGNGGQGDVPRLAFPHAILGARHQNKDEHDELGLN
jgi:hypothetical protein